MQNFSKQMVRRKPLVLNSYYDLLYTLVTPYLVRTYSDFIQMEMSQVSEKF
jgi:hypothetical protein